MLELFWLSRVSNVATKEQIRASLEILKALADTIKELKQVPSGELYARVMSYMSLNNYQSAIHTLIRSGVIRQENNLLIWNVE
jgi:hypothetical protein